MTTTPLPAARPSFFTTYGGPNSSQRRGDLGGRWCRRETARSAHRRRAMTSLANAFEPSSCGGRRGRAEAGDALGPHRVGDPGDQRRLRADHDQVGADLDGQRGDRVGVDRVDRRAARRPRRCPGCPAPRSASTPGEVGGEADGQGMLTPAGTDQKYAHDVGSYRPHRRSRSCRTTFSSRPGPDADDATPACRTAPRSARRRTGPRPAARRTVRALEMSSHQPSCSS